MSDAAADRAYDPSDPWMRQAQTFPELSTEQIDRIAAFGTVEGLPAGTVLVRRGDRAVDFRVVIDGAIEIVDEGTDHRAEVLTVHGPGQFAGELDLFNNRAVLVGARTGADSRILRVPRRDFRRMLDSEPDIGEIVTRAFILRRVGLMLHAQAGVLLIGSPHDAEMLRIERFLARNGYPHRVIDSDRDPDAEGFAECLSLGRDDLPAVILPGGEALRNPATPDLADRLGLTEDFDPSRIHDVAVVGAGPAGLAAAVYAASEGLDTIVIEALAPGGQAGTSSRIENYLGFPTGISGQALAGRAQVQAQKFGARLAISRKVVKLDCAETPYCLELEGGARVATRAVVIATGARYRRLDVPDYDRFEGCGIHYAATWLEGNLCANEEVVVVGGGNSAGQAAVFLSQHARHVHILVRGPGLAATMSDYLIQRIDASAHITLHPHSEIVALAGERYLEQVTWRDRESGAEETHSIGNLFVMIGASPNTEWLENCVALDRGGFVYTGQDGNGIALASPYATERPGIFAVGDVRAGSTKRVASGVGEGSVVVSAIHAWLAEARD